MFFKIKSPEVARRLRGMGGDGYAINVGQLTEQHLVHARHFSPRGLNFDALCRAGCLWISMSERPRWENQRLVQREINRQIQRGAPAKNPLLSMIDLGKPLPPGEVKAEPKHYCSGDGDYDREPRADPRDELKDYIEFIPFDG